MKNKKYRINASQFVDEFKFEYEKGLGINKTDWMVMSNIHSQLESMNNAIKRLK